MKRYQIKLEGTELYMDYIAHSFGSGGAIWLDLVSCKKDLEVIKTKQEYKGLNFKIVVWESRDLTEDEMK